MEYKSKKYIKSKKEGLESVIKEASESDPSGFKSYIKKKQYNKNTGKVSYVNIPIEKSQLILEKNNLEAIIVDIENLE